MPCPTRIQFICTVYKARLVMKHPVPTPRTENVDMNTDLDVDMHILKHGSVLYTLQVAENGF